MNEVQRRFKEQINEIYNIKSCTTCGGVMAKGLKKCPHCGKDQRGFIMRHKILTGFAVLMFVGFVGHTNPTTAAASHQAAPTLTLTQRRVSGVTIGMTEKEVLESNWGKPQQINRTINEYDTTEQWCYNDYHYLYFTDGILDTIQD